MNRYHAIAIGAGIAVYALVAWLVYVVNYRRSADETIARLVMSGADRLRERYLVSEGINEDGTHRW